MRRRADAALAALVACVAATAGAQEPAWPYAPTARAHVAVNAAPEATAEVVGLPTLHTQALPAGYREYRFELECGMCLPQRLVRIRRDARGRTTGEAYALWMASDRGPGVDSLSARMITAGCDGPLRPAAARERPSWHLAHAWCPMRVAADVDWPALLARLDTLGALDLATVDGFVVPPPIRVDTVRAGGRVRVTRNLACQDVGGTSLHVHVLEGERYRAAEVTCLETSRSAATLQGRVAEAVAQLVAILPRP